MQNQNRQKDEVNKLEILQAKACDLALFFIRNNYDKGIRLDNVQEHITVESEVTSQLSSPAHELDTFTIVCDKIQTCIRTATVHTVLTV